jgi:hypothetical protein
MGGEGLVAEELAIPQQCDAQSSGRVNFVSRFHNVSKAFSG